jgi:PAS domain S-box-containing protein
VDDDTRSLSGIDETAALRTILEGTATEVGERFFPALVQNLARALNSRAALVTEYVEECGRLRALAFWVDGHWNHGYEYDVAGTPCEPVVKEARFFHLQENVQALFPNDNDLREINAVSYLGVPLTDLDGRVLGHLAVLDSRPMPEEARAFAVFRIFAARAAAELRRLRAEAEVREREQKLGRLVDSALDAIIELDDRLRVTRLNPAAEKVFDCAAAEMTGEDFNRLLMPESRDKLLQLLEEVETRPHGERSLWIPGGLIAVRSNGDTFPAEATLSHFEMRRRSFCTLILRNVNDRIEAERRIRSLTEEAEYLREEVRAQHDFDEIVGKSPALLGMLRQVEQVADTDSTVLILGETGTGKEGVARAIHARSQRRDKPLITVNCAAVPATVIESEFFGHEQGAFTGATRKREGRFALADGGTIFLDEIGELPVELQAKLLRVLQEGEFEPVGSSQTTSVDVRILAATNRDLLQSVNEGRFRQDLYYRLSVFPIEVPPLRARGDDVVVLATEFAERFALRMGRQIHPLSPECVRRLQAYDWPGNVRELQNVIERAVITAGDGHLDLRRFLTQAGDTPESPETSKPTAKSERVLDMRQWQQREKENLLLALTTCHWRVAGDNGAARLLGMPPSTLTSRMKALGIRRPTAKKP